MKHYTTLIRLKQQELDQLQKHMGMLQQQHNDLNHRIDSLSEQLYKEISLAGHMTEMGMFFGDFSEAIGQQQEEVRVHIRAVEAQMQGLRDKMIVLFAEQKKFDLARQRRIAEHAYRQEQREQQRMDEIAGTRHEAGAI